MSRYAAALDFGSSKVALAVGEKLPTGIRIVSYHDAESAGIECGEIVNDFKVEETVRALVEQAAAELHEPIESVSIGLSGRALHSKDLPCTINRPNPKAYITEDEVREITRKRYNATLEGDEVVFEAIPQAYSTEDRIGITHDELIGMVGGRIEAGFKLFYGRKSIVDRRITVLDKCGLHLDKAILSPIASARAVLSRPEMENGVALVDIGKGSTEVAIVKDNIVRHVAIIPFGGDSVTADIKNELNITARWAEIIKIEHGRCCEEYAVENKKLVLKNENDIVDGEVELILLARVIEARMSEIFDAVRYVIDQSGYAQKISGGVVITGGCCHLDNIIQLAGALLGQKVRLAAPQGSIDSNSQEAAFDVYASTAVGLVLESLSPMLSHAIDHKKAVEAQPAVPSAQTLFTEEKPEEEEERPSAREERRQRKEEERQRKEEERLRKEEARRQKEEERRRAKEAEANQPSIWDTLFSKNDKA
jgi:cell division protein FtsA